MPPSALKSKWKKERTPPKRRRRRRRRKETKKEKRERGRERDPSIWENLGLFDLQVITLSVCVFVCLFACLSLSFSFFFFFKNFINPITQSHNQGKPISLVFFISPPIPSSPSFPKNEKIWSCQMLLRTWVT